jgi:hypothetical protein
MPQAGNLAAWLSGMAGRGNAMPGQARHGDEFAEPLIRHFMGEDAAPARGRVRLDVDDFHARQRGARDVGLSSIA